MKTQEKVTHTPTPWKVETEDKGLGWWNDTVFVVGEGFRLSIGTKTDKTLEKAAFIVRAVNSHEELVSFVKYVRQFYQDNFGAMPVAFQTVDNEAETVLAKAEQGGRV
jgi:hypothetical protein